MRLWGLAILAVVMFVVEYLAFTAWQGFMFATELPLGIGEGMAFAWTECILGFPTAGPVPILIAFCVLLSLTHAAFLLATMTPVVAGSAGPSRQWVTLSAGGIVGAMGGVCVLALLRTLDLFVSVPVIMGGTERIFVAATAAFTVCWGLAAAVFERATRHSLEPERVVVRLVFLAVAVLCALACVVAGLTWSMTGSGWGDATYLLEAWVVAVGLWCGGAWILRKRTARMRRALASDRCWRCGHARAPGGGSVCPECGSTHAALQ